MTGQTIGPFSNRENTEETSWEEWCSTFTRSWGINFQEQPVAHRLSVNTPLDTT